MPPPPSRRLHVSSTTTLAPVQTGCGEAIHIRPTAFSRAWSTTLNRIQARLKAEAEAEEARKKAEASKLKMSMGSGLGGRRRRRKKKKKRPVSRGVRNGTPAIPVADRRLRVALASGCQPWLCLTSQWSNFVR